MTDIPTSETRIRVADLSPRKPHRFAFTADDATCAAIARRLDLVALRKVSLVGKLRAVDRKDWHLDAALGATAVQSCVLTLAPVTTRIDVPVVRHYLHDWVEPVETDEMEMPEDESAEPLPAVIDLVDVLTEALALALPDYPRAEGAELEQTVFAPEGATPLRDTDTKPFAVLASLKDKLGKSDT